MIARDALSIIKQTGAEYVEDKVPKLAAALAYYTVLSLAPMLVLSIVILGLIFGEEAAAGGVESQLSEVVGASAAGAINDMIANAQTRGSGILATIISLVVLLFGASGVFAELQDSMNTIFDVKKKPSAGIMSTIIGRLMSMGMVLGVAFLLLVSLVVSTVLSAIASAIAGGWAVLGYVLDLTISTAVVAILFAAIFKVLPDVKISWKDTLIGALVTAVLFTLGKIGLGVYLSYGSTASAYGAAGSLAALLIWIYYSSQIMFIGAEFTQVMANRFGGGIVPNEYAERVGAKRVGGERSASDGSGGSKTAMARRTTVVATDRPVHHSRRAMMDAKNRNGDGAVAMALPALTMGVVVGGLGALLGVKAKHRVRSADFKARRVSDRIADVEDRIDSFKRLEIAAEEKNVTDRLREIERRIVRSGRRSCMTGPAKWTDYFG